MQRTGLAKAGNLPHGPFPLRIFKEQARERRAIFILPRFYGHANKKVIFYSMPAR
jgi:hypothetical protein